MPLIYEIQIEVKSVTNGKQPGHIRFLEFYTTDKKRDMNNPRTWYRATNDSDSYFPGSYEEFITGGTKYDGSFQFFDFTIEDIKSILFGWEHDQDPPKNPVKMSGWRQFYDRLKKFGWGQSSDPKNQAEIQLGKVDFMAIDDTPNPVLKSFCYSQPIKSGQSVLLTPC